MGIWGDDIDRLTATENVEIHHRLGPPRTRHIKDQQGWIWLIYMFSLLLVSINLLFFLVNPAFLFIRCVISVEITFLFCYFLIFSLFSFGNLFVLSNTLAHNYAEFCFNLHPCFAQPYPDYLPFYWIIYCNVLRTVILGAVLFYADTILIMHV